MFLDSKEQKDCKIVEESAADKFLADIYNENILNGGKNWCWGHRKSDSVNKALASNSLEN